MKHTKKTKDQYFVYATSSCIKQFSRQKRRWRFVIFYFFGFFHTTISSILYYRTLMYTITDQEFSRVMAQALDTLPEVYANKLDNILITYSDMPSEEQAAKTHLDRHHTLLGLFEGVPLTEKGYMKGLFAGGIEKPAKITLFKLPILQRSHSPEDMHKTVREVLWHELAHYFGLNHEDIDKLID